MKPFRWNDEKDRQLQAERGISFAEVVAHITGGDVLATLLHPNQARYPGQMIYIVRMRNYAWLVPFVESESEIFLKTIIPNRKATRKYLGGTT